MAQIPYPTGKKPVAKPIGDPYTNIPVAPKVAPTVNYYANIPVAPKVAPTVNYVRPTNPAPQGNFGSPSAMGFNPAYTPTVQPQPNNKGFTAAPTTQPNSFFPTKEFWADPTGYGQPFYDKVLSKILPSEERLDNSNFSYLNLLNPKNDFKPSMIPGMVGSAVPGGVAFNLLGEAIQSSGYEDTISKYGPLAVLGVTAAKMYGHKTDPIAMARDLMPLFKAGVTSQVISGLNNITGYDWKGAAPAIWPYSNLGYVNPQYTDKQAITPYTGNIYPQTNKQEITPYTGNIYPLTNKQEITPYGINNLGDTYTEQDGSTRFVPWIEKNWKSIKDSFEDEAPEPLSPKDNPLEDPSPYPDGWEFMMKLMEQAYGDTPAPTQDLETLDKMSEEFLANGGPDSYIDHFGNEWISKEEYDYFMETIQNDSKVEHPDSRDNFQIPDPKFMDSVIQNYNYFVNEGWNFDKFPADVTPYQEMDADNKSTAESLSLYSENRMASPPKSMFGDETKPWDYKQRPDFTRDEYGNFNFSEPLSSMGDSTLKTLPMGKLSVSDQIELRRNMFFGRDLDNLPDNVKEAIYKSFGMGGTDHLEFNDAGNTAVLGESLPDEFDTSWYMNAAHPLMNYIDSNESGLPNLGDFLKPTGTDDQGRVTFEGDYYDWEQKFREAYRDNPGLFQDIKKNMELFPKWGSHEYRSKNWWE